jgi:Ca2+-transporting ATPase
VGWEIGLLIAIIYMPFFQPAFGTFSLTRGDSMLVLGFAFSIVPVVQAVKWMARRGWLEPTRS